MSLLQAFPRQAAAAKTAAEDGLFQEPVRSPLARGRRYQFRGYPSRITINAVAFRGHPQDDGGLQGVSVSWWGGIRRPRMWYPVKSEEEFWAMDIFRNAFDCPLAMS